MDITPGRETGGTPKTIVIGQDTYAGGRFDFEADMADKVDADVVAGLSLTKISSGLWS